MFRITLHLRSGQSINVLIDDRNQVDNYRKQFTNGELRTGVTGFIGETHTTLVRMEEVVAIEIQS